MQIGRFFQKSIFTDMIRIPTSSLGKKFLFAESILRYIQQIVIKNKSIGANFTLQLQSVEELERF